jgi:hypothetical protein
MRIVTQIGPDKPDKTVDSSSGRREKQQTQRDLACHQNIMRSFSAPATGGAPGAGVHELRYLWTREVESWRQTRQDACDDGDSDAEA